MTTISELQTLVNKALAADEDSIGDSYQRHAALLETLQTVQQLVIALHQQQVIAQANRMLDAAGLPVYGSNHSTEIYYPGGEE